MALSCTHTVPKWFEASSWLQEMISLWLFELDHCCGRRKKAKISTEEIWNLSRGSPNARWCIVYGLDWLKFLMGAGRGVSKRRRLKEASLQKSASWAWDRGASSSQEQADAIKSKQFLTMPFHHHRHEVSTILSKICASFRKPAQPSLLLCHLSGRNSHSSSDAATACSREAFHGERIGSGEDLRGANVELNRLGNAGQLKEVVQMLDLMEHRGIRAYKRTYSTLLQVSALLWIWTSNHKI